MTDRPQLHRSYTRIWFGALVLFLVTEAAAIARGKPGGTLSQHVWRIEDRLGFEGVLIMAVWGWLGWHFTRGNGRPLGWPDLLAALFGVGVWYVGVYLRVRGTT